MRQKYIYENSPAPVRTPTKTPTERPAPSRKSPAVPDRKPGPGRRPKRKASTFSSTTAPAPTRTPTKTPTERPAPSRKSPAVPDRKPGPGRRPKRKALSALKKIPAVKNFLLKRLNRQSLNESRFKITNSVNTFNDLAVFLNEDIDTGDYQDLIHPDVRRKIEELDDVGIENIVRGLSIEEKKYLNVISSKRYQELCQDLERYVGVKMDKESPRPTLMNILFSTIEEIKKIEKSNRGKLEELAKNSVLSLPEHSRVKQLIDDGIISIKVELTSRELTLDRESDEFEEPGLSEDEEMDLDIFEDLQDIDQHVVNRKFSNFLIAGAAQNKRKFIYLIKEELDKISDKLFNMYLMVMTVGDFSFWTYPPFEELPGGALGIEGIGEEEDVDIYAAAMIFPILVHEFSKGIMEFVHYADFQRNIGDDSTLNKVYRQADKFKYEQFQLMLGSEFDKLIRSFIDYKDLQYLPTITARVAQLPDKDKRNILLKNNTGNRIMKDIINKVKNEYRDADEDYDREMRDYLYGNDENFEDY